MSDACPCGSGDDFAVCCGPHLAARSRPETAEALMRSRYSAFVRGDIGYLQRTSDPAVPRTPPDPAWLARVHWLGLTVVHRRDGGPAQDSGEVGFIARFREGAQSDEIAELSRFRRIRGRWVYVDGSPLPADLRPRRKRSRRRQRHR